MSGLTPAFAHVRQSQKWDVFFFPHPAHSAALAPSDYHLYGPVRQALNTYNFASENELKQSFHDVLQSQGTEFYITGT
jgi:hypothetical protein